MKTTPRVTQSIAVALCLMTVGAGASACGTVSGSSAAPSVSDSPSAETSPSSAPAPSSASPAGQGNDGDSLTKILDAAFPGQTKIQGFANSAWPFVDDTLASVPEDVSRVTVAFVCAGNTPAATTIYVDGKPLSSGSATHPCDKSVFRKTVPVSSSTSLRLKVNFVDPNTGQPGVSVPGRPGAWGFYPG